jgi:prepilin-type N-terminal cleavage/methylation domain-containing protein
MNTKGNRHERSGLAFTLIEMLTVITIMGIIAGLVVYAGQQASQKKKIVAVEGEKNRLITMIDNYYAKLNYYPPDNGALISNNLAAYNYDTWSATNPLIYELFGATNTSVSGALGGGVDLVVFNSSNSSQLLVASAYAKVFNRGGIANGDAFEPHNFFQPGPAPKEYAAYSTNYTPLVCGLVVPSDLVPGNTNNFWHYDSSTTNRHNMATYDLWAEFSIGAKNGQLTIITNGNW